ncbi:MAG: hypothetical protein CFE24_10900 [Flavobacterium sp. BFFFF2]|nr:MAG: hypothetical protein CFE24_10900 [Flavobacterium sp. BFFFF2]
MTGVLLTLTGALLPLTVDLSFYKEHLKFLTYDINMSIVAIPILPTAITALKKKCSEYCFFSF